MQQTKPMGPAIAEPLFRRPLVCGHHGVVGRCIFRHLQGFGFESVSGFDTKESPSLADLSVLVTEQKPDVVFLALPTPTASPPAPSSYDTSAIRSVLRVLAEVSAQSLFDGIVIVNSTVTPGTCERLASETKLRIVHNPEFLSQKTSFEDYANQKEIFIGKTTTASTADGERLSGFMRALFPGANVSVCDATTTEATKIFCNAFYASKVQLCTEFFLMCRAMCPEDPDAYDKVVGNMLRLGWIHPMHTRVPGHDGHVSFGGACFPKDIRACVAFAVSLGTTADALKGVVSSHEKTRNSE